jgi:protein TonB
MTLHWTLARMTPIVASVLLHIVAYGGIAMVPKFTAVREHVLLVDLVEPDPAPPAPPPKAAAPPRPKPVDVRPLTLPKPVQTPMPVMKPPPPVEPPVEAAPPPPPVVHEAPIQAPTPSPVPTPAVAAAPRATAPADSPATGGDDGLPISVPPRASTTTPPGSVAGSSGAAGSSVAALPPDGVTQTAIPRGGYQVRPSYPHTARRLGIQGTTLLSVFVAADGRVSDVVVKQSGGHPDLDSTAAEAVKRWRFEPARRGSEAVAMWVLLPFEWRLR